MRARCYALGLGLLLLARPALASAAETIRYSWKLDGFVGALAALFVPSGGEGVLTFVPQDGGVVRGELLVTSTKSKAGDYFRYGSEWVSESGRTLRAWSDQLWRGEQKSKRSEVEQAGVIDIVSGIQLLRRDPPTVARRLEIWSDGRLYPVVVLPLGLERRHMGGREVMARHLEIRGVLVTDRKPWKGGVDLWLADDAAATPVEIQVERNGVRVRLVYAGGGVEASSSQPTPGGV